MSDNLTMMLLLVAAVAAVAAGVYFFVLRPKGEVRKIDAAHQERAKASGKTSGATPTVAKTAQLSALRDRLAEAQPSPAGLKKLPSKPPEASKSGAGSEKSWRPEDAGLAEAEPVQVQPTVRAPIAPIAPPLPVTEPIKPVAKPIVIEAPAQAEAAAPAPIAHPIIPAPGVAPPAPASGKIQILLVDDSKVVRVKTEKLLTNQGYAVTTAVDGIDALAKLETLKPAIIVTDIEMPNLDGFGLVRNVRGNLRTAEIPVIVMTSHVNLHLDIAATEGINGFLPKPFNDQDLLDQVAFLCES